MADMKKIGIMGGTFNPIHNGHLGLARKALVQFGLEKVLFMPSKVPPHKKLVLSEEHRSNMIQLAIENYEYFEFSDFELQREEVTYTYRTLELLKEENPNCEYYFIMGADSLFQFETWKNPELVSQYATILVAKRNNVEDDLFYKRIDFLNEKYSANILSIDMEEIPFSSTDIRIQVANNGNISQMLPEKVIDYISKNMLYNEYKCKITTRQDIPSLCEDLKKRLKFSRYEHTISVANMCSALAMRYEYNVFDAYVAGLLHDIAKCISDEETLRLCKENSIKISEIERKSPYLLHGKLGAYIAKTEYFIWKEDIINSIIYHTTGRPNMGLLEKIVFVSDYIEPLRDKAPNLDYLRRLAFEDIDKAVTLILKQTLEYLTATGSLIDNTTQKTYMYYKSLT